MDGDFLAAHGLMRFFHYRQDQSKIKRIGQAFWIFYLMGVAMGEEGMDRLVISGFFRLLYRIYSFHPPPKLR
jgi:uncharacterized membrane-anchored protein